MSSGKTGARYDYCSRGERISPLGRTPGSSNAQDPNTAKAVAHGLEFKQYEGEGGDRGERKGDVLC